MKVLLLPNFQGWAFDNIAQGIKKYGSHDYQIEYEVDYRSYRLNREELPKEVLNFDEYDRVILFSPWMRWKNMPVEKTICLVHEASEINQWKTKDFYKVFLTSDISVDLFSQDNSVKVQAGYDPDLFYITGHQKGLGWVGAVSGVPEKKGYEKYYLPLASKFLLKPHIKEDNYTDFHSSMLDYYRTIDMLICTSSWEGYPLPIIEATACGIPVVSTRVGIAPEILPEDQIVERDVGAFRNRLRGSLCLGNLQGWSWPTKIKEWEDNL